MFNWLIGVVQAALIYIGWWIVGTVKGVIIEGITS